MCLNTGASRDCRPSSFPILHVNICPRHFACSHSEPSTSSASRLFCRLTRARPGLKGAEKEWLQEPGTKLDWIKYKAEGGGRRNQATHTPIRDPSLDAGFSGLSIKTSSNQPSTVNSHLWKARFFLIATCRPLGSAAASRQQLLRT